MTLTPIENKRILITGGSGFLGRYVVKKCVELGCRSLIVPRSSEYDLRLPLDIRRLFEETHPQIVIHLAAYDGGMLSKLLCQGELFYSNTMMDIQLIEFSRLFGTEKFIVIGSICSYPSNIQIPFQESDLWNGYPNPSVATYGLSKRILITQLQTYRAQYGFKGIYLILANLYGPGDKVDEKMGRFIPTLIRKSLDARNKQTDKIHLTGDPSIALDYFYVEDAAEAIVLATKAYHEPEPLNFGSGVPIHLGQLADIIARECGFYGRLKWKKNDLIPHHSRVLNIDRARSLLGFEPKMALREGLHRTVEWHRLKDLESAGLSYQNETGLLNHVLPKDVSLGKASFSEV